MGDKMKRFSLVLCLVAGLVGAAVAQTGTVSGAGQTTVGSDATAAPPGGLNLLPPRDVARSVASGERRVSLKAFADMIARSDELIRAQRLEENIAEEGVRGAQGIFDPFVFMALEREGSHVLTSAQDAQRLGVLPRDIFDSRESRLKTGVTLKGKAGADIELSYNISSLVDSIQPHKVPLTSPEYKGYLGVKITQPLLRGAGIEATRSGIVIAETDKGLARETVRQLMTQRVMEGVQAYIFTQRAEERVRVRTQALATAAEIEREMTQQQKAGLRSSSELTEARASLALRRAQLAQAQQELEEQQSSLQVFISAREPEANTPLAGTLLRPADSLELALPASNTVPADLQESAAVAKHLDSVLMRRPEARANVIRIERDKLKVEAARNQKLPELNLNFRLGKQDLSAATRPLTSYFSGDVPYNSWQVGLTFKMALFDDQKKNSEHQTAIYRLQQTELALGAVRQRIANEVRASASLLDKARQQVARQREIVEAQNSLLRAEREMLREGRRSMLDVLRKQLEVYLADEALSDAVAQANRASYLTSQVEGNLLSRLTLE